MANKGNCHRASTSVHGVWVPAFAGTTQIIDYPSK
jgi:hypothetical protein